MQVNYDATMQIDFTRRCGVYYITNTLTGAIYVGCSADVYVRLAQHITALSTRQSTGSLYLARDWHIYGREAFTFELVEECDLGERLERERAHMLGLLAAGNVLLNDRLPVVRREAKHSSYPRPVRCIDTGALYESVSAAARAAGFTRSTPIYQAIKKGYKANGCKWQYA